MHTCMRVYMSQKEKCNLLYCLDKAHKVSSKKKDRKKDTNNAFGNFIFVFVISVSFMW